MTSLRHRLKDDLVLMKKADAFKELCYIKDCVALSYVLYQSGDIMLQQHLLSSLRHQQETFGIVSKERAEYLHKVGN